MLKYLCSNGAETQDPLCFQGRKSNTLPYWTLSISGISFTIAGVSLPHCLSPPHPDILLRLETQSERGRNGWRQAFCFQCKPIQLIIKQLSALKCKMCSCRKFHSKVVKSSSLNWIFWNYMVESRKGLQKALAYQENMFS